MVQFKLDERLIYVRPDGVQYQLHAPPVRAILSEEGLGIPPLVYVADQAPFQNGDTVRSFNLGVRPVQLIIIQNFCSRAEYWTGRNALIDAVRPNRITDFSSPGKLLYYLANRQTRQLDVFLEAGPGFAPPQDGWRAWSFTEVLRFVAHDPTWYDPTLRTVVFGSGGFNLVFPITFPIQFSSLSVPTAVTYTGTWLAYPTITITGPIVSPRIVNQTTGDLLQLNTTLASGESVIINLKGAKTITRNDGTNLLNTLSADSDLTTFSLVPAPQAAGGINTLVATGTGATVGQTSVSISWYSRYLGI